MSPRDMTDEQLRVKVAELLGWHHIHSDGPGSGLWMGYPRFLSVENEAGEPSILPNYPQDLNACHEMELSLSADGSLFLIPPREAFRIQLGAVCYRDGSKDSNERIHATARQRCEAFVLTMEGHQ